MLNKIMMTGRLDSEPAVYNENGFQYCRFSIVVDRSKCYGTDKDKNDNFNCIAYDRNGEMISNLFSKGEMITLVGLLRNTCSNSAEIVVEEVHFSGGGQKSVVSDRLLF